MFFILHIQAKNKVVEDNIYIFNYLKLNRQFNHFCQFQGRLNVIFAINFLLSLYIYISSFIM